MNKNDLPRLYEKATEEADKFIQNVKEVDLEKQSVDRDWTVRELINHIVYEQLWLPELLEGKTIKEVGDKYEGDLLGDDFKKVWKDVKDRVNEAVKKEGALTGIAHLSFGDVPSAQYVGDMLFDLTVHAWDVAFSTGQEDELDSELLDIAYDHASQHAEGWRKVGALGPEIKVSEDASKLTKMLALTGRKRESS